MSTQRTIKYLYGVLSEIDADIEKAEAALKDHLERQDALGIREEGWHINDLYDQRQVILRKIREARCISEFGCTRSEMNRGVRAITGSWSKEKD